MSTLQRIFIIFLIASLLSGCGASASLWGDLPTPTLNAKTPSATPIVFAPAPSLTPSPSLTALKVLPLPGTPTPAEIPNGPTPTLPPVNTAGPMIVYKSQGGDTLDIVANRFGVSLNGIISDVVLPPTGVLLKPGTLLLIPNRLNNQTTPGEQTIPDSEVVYSPSTIGFDAADYIRNAHGYLSTYKESLSSDAITGIQAVQRIALENSLNPRMVLAIIEYESHWVLGQPTNLAQDAYPLGYTDYHNPGLFRQLMWASGVLSAGYYGWRAGTLTELSFIDGSRLRLDPRLNAGTAAIQYFFSRNHTRAEWEQAVAPTGFAALYRGMFGDPWERAGAVEPLLPAGLAQPELSLPFQPKKVWSFSGGPHSAWEEEGALAALDFAPSAEVNGCVKSDLWILAPAAGTVVRTAKGVVMLDLTATAMNKPAGCCSSCM
jgi:LasA protease